MIELFENNIKMEQRKSSKGNQLKWLNGNSWYKADYTGYEGLAEYVISQLLVFSTLPEENYILYDTEEIRYRSVRYLGCKSKNFLPEGWQLITLERLFQNFYSESLYKSIYRMNDIENRIRFLVEQVERITNLKNFGRYISILLTVDALFINEDRHTHNIAVLMDEKGMYHYCPIFDNGAGVCSDTTMDYPMDMEVEKMLESAKAKTFCGSFEEQLDAVEKLYGQHVKFRFTIKDIEQILEKELYYPEEVKKRVKEILVEQRRKYSYLF